MAIAHSNRLLPILAGIVLVVTVVVVLKSCSGESDRGVVMEAVPQAAIPDADTPADTIKTLTANVSAMTAALATLRRDNAGLKQENQLMANNQRQMEESIGQRLEQSLLNKARENESQGAAARATDSALIESLSARIDALSQRLSSGVNRQLSAPSSDDMPVGLGLDAVRRSVHSSATLVWTEPLEALEPKEDRHGRLLKKLDLSSVNELGSNKPLQTRRHSDTASAIIDPITPVFTIPRNATLIGSTAMTALIGRVPVQGQVRDAMPFKVITGADNLAANGLSVPGVQGMVWSGTAMGDWTLSCVSGRLESVTFVFDDGTIQTHSSDDMGAQTSGNHQQKSLGWISDARGIPCITGERKTNAPAFLSQRLGVKAIEAAAQAAAQAETTTLINDEGTGSRQVTGDIGKYLAGKTLSGGSQEMAQWLQERQAQSFDAVFVPAGIALAIHIDREIPIDFNANGRKLYYGHSPGTSARDLTVMSLD